MRPHRVSHPAVVGLAIAAIAAPAAAAAEQPYHPRGLDHMSELGRDPEPAATSDEGGVGAAIDDRPRRAQQQRLAAQVVKVPQPVPEPASTGFDWADASVGAGGMLGLTLLVTGGSLALVHRRRHMTPTV